MIRLSSATVGNWFWLADDGRVYSTSANAIVQPADAGYVAWKAAGTNASRWPHDDSGAQTIAALDEVLQAYGRSTGLAPPTAAQLRAHAGAKVAALLSVERGYTLAAGVIVKCDASASTAANLASLGTWAAANQGAATQWIDDEGAVTSITGAQATALAAAVSAYGQAVRNENGAVFLAIASGAITTTAQIDSVPWPA